MWQAKKTYRFFPRYALFEEAILILLTGPQNRGASGQYMNQNSFVYTIDGRVIWLCHEVFNIPVLNELYCIHKIAEQTNVTGHEVLNYRINSPHFFLQDKMVYSPISESLERETMILHHEKIKCFAAVSEFTQYSYQAMLPGVFDSNMKIEVLIEQTAGDIPESSEAFEKHKKFIKSCVEDKTKALKKNYLAYVSQIRQAKTAEEVIKIRSRIVYAEINAI